MGVCWKPFFPSEMALSVTPPPLLPRAEPSTQLPFESRRLPQGSGGWARSRAGPALLGLLTWGMGMWVLAQHLEVL